ncbi:MAG: transposase [Fusobacterium sp.]|nr:transposase [Fusobacterium sp.]
MNKKKYTEEQIKNILAQENKKGDIAKICKEYDIHISTFYRWKNIYSESNDNRNFSARFRMSQKEYDLFKKRCKELGYENNHSAFIRKIIFDKAILVIDPKKMFHELNSLRAELNKIGSNLNQVAHYANFLNNQKYLEDKPLKEFQKVAFDLKKKEIEIVELMKKLFAKI